MDMKGLQWNDISMGNYKKKSIIRMFVILGLPQVSLATWRDSFVTNVEQTGEKKKVTLPLGKKKYCH